MRILFDLISTQTFFGNGGAEYVRKVFYALCDKIDKESNRIELMFIYDSDRPQDIYEELSPQRLKDRGFQIIDIKNNSLLNIITKGNIDVLFIGIAQFWGKYDIDNIPCRTIIVIHDLFQEEFSNSHLKEYLCFPFFNKLIIEILRPHLHRIKNYLNGKPNNKNNSISRLLKNINEDTQNICVVVSNYTKFSVISNYMLPDNKIHVLYSPERRLQNVNDIDNTELKNLILSQKKYYLILSANRPAKNAIKAIKAFNKYRNGYLKKNKIIDLPILVTVGSSQLYCEGQVNLPPLSESDLVHAYKNCFAFVYPSYFEGFGYPPMEAMKYSKPILASNTTSIPEILGDAAIYFSPFYETDIFKAFCTLKEDNYQEYSNKSALRYNNISRIQRHDLEQLIQLIIK